MKKNPLVLMLTLFTILVNCPNSAFALTEREELTYYGHSLIQKSNLKLYGEAIRQAAHMTFACPMGLYSAFTAFEINTIPILSVLANKAAPDVYDSKFLSDEYFPNLYQGMKEAEALPGVVGGIGAVLYEALLQNTVRFAQNLDMEWHLTKHAYAATVATKDAFLGPESRCFMALKKAMLVRLVYKAKNP